MWTVVVDDDLQARAELFQARYHVRFAEVIGDDPDLGLRIGDRQVEDLEDGVACLESHPGQSLLRLGMSWRKVQAFIRLFGQQQRYRALGLVTVDECLRRH